VHTKGIVLTCAVVASLLVPLSARAEAPISLNPRDLGSSVAYHLESDRSGTKETQHVDTTLTIKFTSSGVAVTSTTPASSADGSLQPDGSITLTSDLRKLIGPYNQLQTALNGMNVAHQSTMRLQMGDTEISVPVSVTSSMSDGKETVVFAGQTDTTVRSAHAHIVVNAQAIVAGGLLVSASARNDITAKVMFRSIHVQQTWSITRQQ
jgi:hypothetical protein